MIVSLLIAGILLICGGIGWFKPQWISNFNGLPPEKMRNVNLHYARRILAGGMVLLAMIIAVGSWLLVYTGVSEEKLVVPQIITLFVGVIIIVALVEMQNRNK